MGAKKTTTKTAGTFDRDDNEDRIGRLLNGQGLVPKKFQDTDEFLDVVSWNIRYFDHADPTRVEHVTKVLAALNADVFVLCEIADDGVLEEVVEGLAKAKAGFYSVEYGTTGGQQRVALLWDRDWVRAKTDVVELFGDEKLTVPAESGTKPQAVFPRLPLWGYFEALADDASEEGFTFEILGLHLKAQGPAPKGYKGPAKRWGIPQRRKAARRLAAWLTEDGDHYDTDVIVVGDWNAKTDETEWKAIRDLEDEAGVVFSNINDPGAPSHLVRLNKSGPAGSRLDLHLVTDTASAQAVPKGLGIVVQWSPFEHLDAFSSKELKDLFKRLKQRFSDHLPVVSRFYLDPR